MYCGTEFTAKGDRYFLSNAKIRQEEFSSALGVFFQIRFFLGSRMIEEALGSLSH